MSCRAGLVALLIAWSATAKAECDEAKLAKLDQFLVATQSDHLQIVAGGLDAACTLPVSLKRALDLMSHGATGLPPKAMFPVAEDRPLWSRACAGGTQVIVDFSNLDLGPRQRAEILWAGCAVEALGVATLDEWRAAGLSAPVALAAHVWLRDAKLAPARLRTYTRALAGLDEPRPIPLAERFPDDGRRTTGATAPIIALQLAGLLGLRSTAETLFHTVENARADFAPCFRGMSLPRGLMVRLVIADGQATDGEILVVSHLESATQYHSSALGAAFERCLLGRLARVRFPSFARPTTIEVGITRQPGPDLQTFDSAGKDSLKSGAAGFGSRNGMGVGGGGYGPGPLPVLTQISATVGAQATASFHAQLKASLSKHALIGYCAQYEPDGALRVRLTLRVRDHAASLANIEPAPKPLSRRCVVDVLQAIHLDEPDEGTVVYDLAVSTR